MIKEIVSFYKTAPNLQNSKIKNETLGDFLVNKNYQSILLSII